MRGAPKFSDKTNITISMDGQIEREIKQYADKQGLSTNAIVNKILKDYVLFGKYFQDHIPIMIAPKVFSLLLSEVDEKIWLKAWDLALKEITPAVFAMHHLEPTLDNLVNHLFGDIGIRIGTFNKFTCHKNDDGDYKMVMTHDYDKKWSNILATSFSEMFEKVFQVETATKISPKTLTLEIFSHKT